MLDLHVAVHKPECVDEQWRSNVRNCGGRSIGKILKAQHLQGINGYGRETAIISLRNVLKIYVVVGSCFDLKWLYIHVLRLL